MSWGVLPVDSATTDERVGRESINWRMVIRVLLMSSSHVHLFIGPRPSKLIWRINTLVTNSHRKIHGNLLAVMGCFFQAEEHKTFGIHLINAVL